MNWAFQKEQKEEVANHFHVFVGDLSSGVFVCCATCCATCCRVCVLCLRPPSHLHSRTACLWATCPQVNTWCHSLCHSIPADCSLTAAQLASSSSSSSPPCPPCKQPKRYSC